MLLTGEKFANTEFKIHIKIKTLVLDKKVLILNILK